MPLYIYALVHPTHPECFKWGHGRAGDRMWKDQRLPDGWRADRARMMDFNAPDALEEPIRDWLVANGHTKHNDFVVLPKNAAERQRVAQNGRHRRAREVHLLNGRTFEEVVALIRQKIVEWDG